MRHVQGANMVDLMSHEEAQARLDEYMDSKEWWVFVYDTAHAFTVEEIERTFYAKEANQDFQMLLAGDLVRLGVTMSFAHKERMSRSERSRLLGQYSSKPIDEQDLFVMMRQEIYPAVRELLNLP